MENFILPFQIDNDDLFDGLIDYHKNNTEYKYNSSRIAREPLIEPHLPRDIVSPFY